jgi:hypothetical protein
MKKEKIWRIYPRFQIATWKKTNHNETTAWWYMVSPWKAAGIDRKIVLVGYSH